MDAVVAPGEASRGGRLSAALLNTPLPNSPSETVLDVGRLIQGSCPRYRWKTDRLLKVASALACPEGRRAERVPPPTIPRSARLSAPRVPATPPLTTAAPLPSSRAGSSD